MRWPATAAVLSAEQARIGAMTQPAWRPAEGGPPAVAGCFVCFPRGLTDRGEAGDRAWAAAAVVSGDGRVARAVVAGAAAAAYVPGMLALREGPLLETAVRALDASFDVLLVNATGRDHPRRCGLAVHLGAVLDVPTVGVTHRALVARGAWPPDAPGAAAPLVLDDEVVGAWLRTRAGARPLAVHAGWRTDVATALAVVRVAAGDARTPRPLRLARESARTARAAAGGNAGGDPGGNAGDPGADAGDPGADAGGDPGGERWA